MPIWSKFFWKDWANDPGLRACGFAARGLWMDLLCIAADANPTGYVLINGNPLDVTTIARLTGGAVTEVEILLRELERNGVFSRNAQQVIYSRRLVRDARLYADAVRNGKKGGNPSLRKTNGNGEGVNPPHMSADNGRLKAQKLEARREDNPQEGYPLSPVDRSSADALRAPPARPRPKLSDQEIVDTYPKRVLNTAEGAELLAACRRLGLHPPEE